MGRIDDLEARVALLERELDYPTRDRGRPRFNPTADPGYFDALAYEGPYGCGSQVR